MKPIRNNSIYISDKVLWYAHILVKAKCNGTKADMTIDNLIDCELTDKWERTYPELVLAYERNVEVRQQSKKKYEEVEQDAIKLISPVPGSKLEPMIE